MKINNFPAVYVKWLDAQSHDDWMSIEDLEDNLPEIHTVGFLIKESSEMITVVQNYDSSNNQISMVMEIPRSWCVEVKQIVASGPIDKSEGMI